jgi:hypothetical protein
MRSFAIQPSQRLIVSAVLLVCSVRGFAATTIDSSNKSAYGANIGWMDWRGDTNNGATIGEHVCSGYVYAANVGWIDLGDGAPANGIQYQNNSATDYGINHDGLGNLRGHAYGANVGWINFENTGAPKVDLKTGVLSGSIYSANCGWISLSNAFAHAQTGWLQPSLDSDGDGIADAWELSHTNTLAALSGNADIDGDGVSDLNEYLADTSPLDPNDSLRITNLNPSFVGGNNTNLLTWTTKPTRLYKVQQQDMLSAGSFWLDTSGLISPDMGGATTRLVPSGLAVPQRFFRVQALKPLAP